MLTLWDYILSLHTRVDIQLICKKKKITEWTVSLMISLLLYLYHWSVCFHWEYYYLCFKEVGITKKRKKIEEENPCPRTTCFPLLPGVYCASSEPLPSLAPENSCPRTKTSCARQTYYTKQPLSHVQRNPSLNPTLPFSQGSVVWFINT